MLPCSSNCLVVIFFSPKSFTVKGKVLDDKGVPLQGATIKEKGKISGTSTDANGAFTLTVSSEKAHLQVMFVGFTTQELDLKGQSILNISLKPSKESLEEVVVVGYSSQKKKDLTGSVSIVSADQLYSAPVRSYSDTLQSKVAGVRIDKNNNTGNWNSPKSPNKNVGDDKEFNTEDYDGITENRFLKSMKTPFHFFY